MQCNYCINCFEALPENGICPQCGYDNQQHAPLAHHIPPGKILLGRYFVGRVLGEGGFGITYFGYDLTLQRKVAIKEYYPTGCVYRNNDAGMSVNCITKEQITESFLMGKEKCIQEARALAKLDDIPGIVRVKDFFEDNNTVYVVMDFIAGVTLKQYLSTLTEPMSAQSVLQLLKPLFYSLNEVHNRGFVHRDISPDNIMLQNDGTAKLLDFGAAKSVVAGGSATTNPILKRGFSPIEQYSVNGKIGPWTDVYALCATVYYCIAGHSAPEPMERLQEDDSWKEPLFAAFPKNQVNAFIKGLNIQPENRFQTVAELCQALFESSDIPDSEEPQTDTKPKKKGVLKKILAGAAAVAIAVGVLFGIRQTGRLNRKSDIVYGRAQENMFSNGMVVQDSEKNRWCYLSVKKTYGNGYCLYKYDYSQKSNPDIQSLNVQAMSVNVVGDTIYYIDYEKTNAIRKISADGGLSKMLYEQSDSTLYQLLYMESSDFKRLYFMEVSNTGDPSSAALVCVDENGKNKKTVIENAWYYSVCDDSIYYIDDGETLMKADFNGENAETVYNRSDVKSFAIYRDELFLQLKDSIVVTDLDGEFHEELSGIKLLIQDDDAFYPILVADGKIFYTNSEDKCLYVCKTDGTDNKCIMAKCLNYEYAPYNKELFFFVEENGIVHTGKYSLKNDTVSWVSPDSPDGNSKYGTANPSNCSNGLNFNMLDDAVDFIDEEFHLSHIENLVESDTFDYYNNSSMSGFINYVGNRTYVLRGGNGGFTEIVRYSDVSAGKIVYTGNYLSGLQYVKNSAFGERLFFIDFDPQTDKSCIYSTNINGEDKKKISFSNCYESSMIISGNRIYYLSDDLKQVCACTLDGKNPYVLYSTDDPILSKCFCVTDEQIFIAQKDQMIRFDLDGNRVKKCACTGLSGLSICGDFLFAVTGREEGSVSVFDPEKMERQKTFYLNKGIGAVNVIPKDQNSVYLYYTSNGDENAGVYVGIYSIKENNFNSYVGRLYELYE